ncbi:MAG: cytochrome P450 [Actinomycetota bacterium]
MAVDTPIFNPLDPATHADPYPSYRQLRELSPIHHSPLGILVLSRFADIDAVLRDPRFGHTMADEVQMLKVMQGPGGVTVAEFSRWMLMLDPPDHTRLRGLVQKAFTPRAIEALRPRITALVDQFVSGFLSRLESEGQADIVDELALALPVAVITEMLGLHIEDEPRTREWAEAIAQALDPIISEEQARRSDEAVVGMTEYITSEIERRRRSPGNDLLTKLIEAEDAGGRLSEQELISNVILLFGAGHETTRNLISNGMLALIRNPEVLAQLRSDPSLIRNAVEELLRYDSPVQLVGRVAKSEIEVAGVPFPTGMAVACIVASGNRDPAQYRDPDRLDILRPDIKVLSFGGGIHFCLGAMLARIEGALAINTLLARAPALALVDEKPQWRPHITLRGLAKLPVRAA